MPTELWGHNNRLSQEDIGFGRLGRAPEIHPLLSGLTHVIPNYYGNLAWEAHHASQPYVYHGMVGHEPHLSPLDAFNRLGTKAYKHKEIKLSDKVRSLLHEPGIAADAAEESGQEELAKYLRNAEHVHTYLGSAANHADAIFMHRRRIHMVAKDSSGFRRHLVGPEIKST